MRRIEKEAYAWADQEIHTTAQAEEFLQRRQARRDLAQQVLQVLQICDRAPSRTERGYITSWLDMGFGCEAIAEAYDRTVVATGARKWPYLNRILMSWHEKGLHTLDEISSGDPRAADRHRVAAAAPAADRDDLDRVEQMLIILLDNAIKNTTAGSIQVNCSKNQKGQTLITVTDTGVGIPQDKQETIFERFGKLDQFKPGSGLGLEICRTIAHKLGGDVYLDPDYTNGARFCFSFGKPKGKAAEV